MVLSLSGDCCLGTFNFFKAHRNTMFCLINYFYFHLIAEAKQFSRSQRSPRIEFIDNKGIYTEASYYTLKLNLTSDEHGKTVKNKTD